MLRERRKRRLFELFPRLIQEKPPKQIPKEIPRELIEGLQARLVRRGSPRR